MSAPRLLARWAIVPAVCALAAAGAAEASAQSLAARATVDAGARTFTAAESFDAVLGTRTGPVFGGGGEIVLPQGIFAGVRVSLFRKTGQRVFVFEGDTFELGIDNTIQVMPVEVTGGYRFGARNRRLIPYAGGGIGWHRYEETSEFSDPDEDVGETFRGYHLLGGAEFRLSRWFGVGGELQWTTVPDALGQDPNGVSAAFAETDLGGVSFRVRFTVGR